MTRSGIGLQRCTRKFAKGPVCAMLLCCAFATSSLALGQQSAKARTRADDWAPELLYDMLSSTNASAPRELLRAAFAAGPEMIPPLQAALKDDRTATFAAREIAYIGGESALPILSSLLQDPRNLNLRRFYYGALGESDNPSSTEILLHQIAHSDQEPDRSVTQAAIIALTVHTDPQVIPRLKAVESRVHDPAIQGDLSDAVAIIRIRAKALASPEWKSAGASIGRTIQSYFLPAFENPPGAGGAQRPPVHVKVAQVTMSPDGSRALAEVGFELPGAVARYDMILKVEGGTWKLASAWLRNETENPPAASAH